MSRRDQESEETDYLWDGSGPVDPEVARLESQLRSFRHQGEPPAFERPVPGPPLRALPFRLPLRGRFGRLALAATLAALAAGLTLTAVYFLRPAQPWQVERIAGRPTIGGTPIGERALLRPGQSLSTDGASRVQLGLAEVGEVEVGPGSEIGLVSSGKTEQRLSLVRGRLRATIWAPPKLFQVLTPSARAVDLGCVYSLEVGAEGEGSLAVESGWVALEARGLESFVPGGAAAAISRRGGPGVPLWSDAPDPLRAFVVAFEAAGWATSGAGPRAAHLAAAMAAARPRDALTLWHLLARGTAVEREILYEPLARLAPPPRGVTRAGIVRGDREQLDAWWNALGLGSTSWWRLWRAPLR
jgi:hypothetical protein